MPVRLFDPVADFKTAGTIDFYFQNTPEDLFFLIQNSQNERSVIYCLNQLPRHFPASSFIERVIKKIPESRMVSCRQRPQNDPVIFQI